MSETLPRLNITIQPALALEAGNSPTIIFKHYRELVTKDDADKWFGIMPENPR